MPVVAEDQASQGAQAETSGRNDKAPLGEVVPNVVKGYQAIGRGDTTPYRVILNNYSAILPQWLSLTLAWPSSDLSGTTCRGKSIKSTNNVS